MISRRAAALLVTAILSALLSGCGSFWPWSGPSKPKMPEPPQVSSPVAARVAWTLKLGDAGIGFSPSYVAGALHAASAKGLVARIDPVSGRAVWQVDLGKKLSAGVGSDGKIVVVVTEDGELIALDINGQRKWALNLGSDAATVPVVGHGVVLLRTGDNRVHAIDAQEGKRRWTFKRQGPPLVLRQTASIMLTPSLAFIGLPSGRLVAVDLRNGAQRWEATVSLARGATEIERISDVVGTPLLIGRQICAANYNGKLACFDALTGRGLWFRSIASSTGVEVDSKSVVIVDAQDQIHAFSVNGASLWKQEKYSGRGLSAGLSIASVLVLGDSKGLIHLVSRDNGAVAGRLSSDGTAIVTQPIAADRLAIVQTSGGSLVAVAFD